MDREILFKAKRLDNGEWVEGYYIGPVGVLDVHEICDIHDITGTRVEVDPSTVCQYTGLTDKNGKKIFEGDIISIENPKPFAPWICKTVYEDFCWWLDGQSKTGKVMLTDYADVAMEVIGSTHDGEGGQ